MLAQKGMVVTVKDIFGAQQTGTIEAFGEYTVILSCGVKRIVVEKRELAHQGYTFPRQKRKSIFSIVN